MPDRHVQRRAAVAYLRRLAAFCAARGIDEADWYARAAGLLER